MSVKREMLFTRTAIMNDSADRYFNSFVRSRKNIFPARQYSIAEGRRLRETAARDDEDGQHGSNRPSNPLIEYSSTDSVYQIEPAIEGKAPVESAIEVSSTDSVNQIKSAIEENAPVESVIEENAPDESVIEDSNTDSVNLIEPATEEKAPFESATKENAPVPPLSENTPQSRRQLVTGFITSIFKYKKNVKIENFGGTDKGKPAGSDSSEPRPTTLGLARIFPYEELMEATNGFKQQVGEGGFSSVYLGKLRDKREVAVKVLYDGIKKRFEQFINEVTVLSRLRHPNLVSLYGCTDPETHKLLIVYEFVPNSTLASHLHGEGPPLSWALRIQIAIEIAMALAYFHSQVPSLIHRDVKTSNILLDNDFHPKVADFGMCRLVPWDTTYVSTQPQGTMGYRDPEYDLNFKLTDKSDVYSFGVVLLEMISGKQAVDVYRDESEIYLIKMALNKILNKNLWQLVDSRLGYDSESEIGKMINSVAELACMCLRPIANKRPPMAEVLMALNGIKSGIQ